MTEAEAIELYDRLVKLPWVEGIRSRRGFTRLAHQLDMESEDGEKVLDVIRDIFVMMKTQDPKMNDYTVHGIYLNYYRDGTMYTPAHSHSGTHQLVVSLGATRTLIVGKKNIPMRNGDAVLFGGSTHSVPPEPSVRGGRISIATFMSPI